MVDYSGREIGRYHIIRPLGTGGMAVVYQAFDERLEREVAVKIIRIEEFAPSLLERVLQRFEREAKTLAKLNHTHIVPIIDFGQQDNIPYLVMPYFQGGTLANLLGTPMPAAQAARLLTPLADALAYAHGKGVLHRDIKPGNILINESGQPMLTDFGIAKLLEGEHGQTLTGTGVGIGFSSTSCGRSSLAARGAGSSIPLAPSPVDSGSGSASTGTALPGRVGCAV